MTSLLIAVGGVVLAGCLLFWAGLRFGLAIRDAESFDRDVRMSARDNYGEDEGLE